MRGRVITSLWGIDIPAPCFTLRILVCHLNRANKVGNKMYFDCYCSFLIPNNKAILFWKLSRNTFRISYHYCLNLAAFFWRTSQNSMICKSVAGYSEVESRFHQATCHAMAPSLHSSFLFQRIIMPQSVLKWLLYCVVLTLYLAIIFPPTDGKWYLCIYTLIIIHKKPLKTGILTRKRQVEIGQQYTFLSSDLFAKCFLE